MQMMTADGADFSPRFTPLLIAIALLERLEIFTHTSSHVTHTHYHYQQVHTDTHTHTHAHTHTHTDTKLKY